MKTKIFLISLIITICFGCQTENPISSADNDLPLSTLEKEGLNPVKLDSLVMLIQQEDSFPDIHSLLIIRNGYLVVEEYFNGYNANKRHMIQSVTKSFTSALIGIAINHDVIANVDQKILSFFPDQTNIENLDERKQAICLQDILTMRTGTDYHENGPDAPHWQLNQLAKGWDTFYLNRPMINEPGTKFIYDSGGVILLSSILKNLTGIHANVFADEYLFNHLNIENKYWVKNNEEHPHTGGGLHITPRDMAKLGLLYLQNGIWEGNQIISKAWIEESFTKHVDFNVPENSPWAGYGYLWWILKLDLSDESKGYIYAACGLWGQYIFVIPEYDMVVAVTAEAKNGNDQYNPISFLYSHIMGARIE